jgi:hypothetical protein
MAYEDALKLEAEVDDLMNDGRVRKDASVEPENIGGKVRCCCRRKTCSTLKTDGDKKVARHRSVQEKFETIYPAWKQLIKEPWKDRGGLERFEYGVVLSLPTCVLLILER